MNTQPISFSFNQKYNVRVQVINGDPWFCINDVCKALTVINSSDLLSKQLDKARVEKIYLRSDGQKRQFAFVNEPNLYRVIFRSNKPEAKQFQDWVFNEVLPSIRKTGKYEHPKY
ncbi:MAG: Bro-N domain-containing protein [Candidatus Phlomobacter fragariae]